MVAATVVRARTVPTRAPIRRANVAARLLTAGDQAVSRAANGLDRRPIFRALQFGTQPPDVHLHYVRIADELEVPDMIEDVPFGEYLSRVMHEVLENGELACSEIYLLTGQPDATRRRVQVEVADLENGGPGPSAASQQCPQPGHEHRIRERFGE